MRMDIRSEQGFAMVTAIVAAVVVASTALLSVNIVMKRFEMAAFRTDRTRMLNASEAAIRYTWTRLDIEDPELTPGVDDTLAEFVETKDILLAGQPEDVREYILAPEPNTGTSDISGDPIDLQVDALMIGGRYVEVRILFDPDGNPAAAPDFRVRAQSNYGGGA